jgi:hypothetical protein
VHAIAHQGSRLFHQNGDIVRNATTQVTTTPVEWVERSDTHLPVRERSFVWLDNGNRAARPVPSDSTRWVSLRSTHPTSAIRTRVHGSGRFTGVASLGPSCAIR